MTSPSSRHQAEQTQLIQQGVLLVLKNLAQLLADALLMEAVPGQACESQAVKMWLIGICRNLEKDVFFSTERQKAEWMIINYHDG